jgi:hypothetical protein
MAGIRQGLLPQVRAACSDEMMPDSLDLPGFSIRIDPTGFLAGRYQ